MTRLDEIPTAFEPPAEARPSAVVARIRSIRPSRRAVLRGLVVGAAAAALVPLDWYLTRREAAAQDRSEGSSTSEHTTCVPENYQEEANNWPANGMAVCYGGWRRGSYPCSDGYHREGSYESNGDRFESTRLTTDCHGKNAWRWKGYRCSDAITRVTFADGSTYSGMTIAACTLEADTEDRRDPSTALPLPGIGSGIRSLPGIGELLGR
ncbi:hypothetical protein [Pseudonocardia nigra]|uniref:hypothetical protein n=1 Tax=Pseudonocardia nigra TaxID=1921578 RepID=UPI001C5F3ABB|nr:hypothetical protein [Pseudonocardia nigra]